MKIYKKIENENKVNLQKIFIPLLVLALIGYFLYLLIAQGFFKGWEVYFAAACYALILLFLIVIDVQIIHQMYYNIYVDEGKLKVRDGFFSRPISLPLNRVHYISTIKVNDGMHYDTVFITDKKINHKKIKPLSEKDFQSSREHLNAVRDLNERYPGRFFYYYRVFHRGYKFIYYFYMLYKSCDKCKFSDTSMELVKMYAHGK